jgi:hypothetical protein
VGGKQLGGTPVYSHLPSGGEIGGDTGDGDSYSPSLAQPGMVSLPKKRGRGSADARHTGLPLRQLEERGTLKEQQVEDVYIQDLWQERVFTWSPRACKVLANAFIDSTFRKYNSYVKRFMEHCTERCMSWKDTTEVDVAAFEFYISNQLNNAKFLI